MRMRSASYSSTTKAAADTTVTASTSLAYASKKLATSTRVPKFLRCLYDILHTEDQAILAWSKDGSHFQILSTSRLETEILPKYFKHGKFASFQRQLNNFGFRKWTKTQSNVCTFSHHHYVRRLPQQLVELVAMQNESSGVEPASPLASGTPHALGSPSGKRKRSESTCEAAKATTTTSKAIKREAGTSQRPVGLPLIKVDPSAFDFEVESWNLMTDVRPLEWAAKSRLAAIKTESGNETPTSAAGFADLAFDFTLEELDDILLTSSHGVGVGVGVIAVDDVDHVASRQLNDWYGVEPPLPLAWADSADLFGKAELEMYMQDTELWANH